MFRVWAISAILLLSGTSLFAQSHNATVEFLNSKLERGRFLHSVFLLDQDVREYEDSVMVASGWKSTEHLKAIDSLMLVDSLLTSQISKYLDFYGFPDKEDFSEVPRITPWLVLHHSSNSEIKRKHFPKLYEAYEDGNLEERRLLMLLQGEYEKIHQQEFQSYSRDEARIRELMKALDLMPAKARKLSRFPGF